VRVVRFVVVDAQLAATLEQIGGSGAEHERRNGRPHLLNGSRQSCKLFSFFSSFFLLQSRKSVQAVQHRQAQQGGGARSDAELRASPVASLGVVAADDEKEPQIE
jgi:hypothetical protein